MQIFLHFFAFFLHFFTQNYCISTILDQPRPRKNPPMCLGRRATRALLPRCVVVIDAHIRGGMVGCNPCGTPIPSGCPNGVPSTCRY